MDYRYSIEIVHAEPANIISQYSQHPSDKDHRVLLLHCVARGASYQCRSIPDSFEVQSGFCCDRLYCCLAFPEEISSGSLSGETATTSSLVIGGPDRVVGAAWIEVLSSGQQPFSSPAGRLFVAWRLERFDGKPLSYEELEAASAPKGPAPEASLVIPTSQRSPLAESQPSMHELSPQPLTTSFQMPRTTLFCAAPLSKEALRSPTDADQSIAGLGNANSSAQRHRRSTLPSLLTSSMSSVAVGGSGPGGAVPHVSILEGGDGGAATAAVLLEGRKKDPQMSSFAATLSSAASVHVRNAPFDEVVPIPDSPEDKDGQDDDRGKGGDGTAVADAASSGDAAVETDIHLDYYATRTQKVPGLTSATAHHNLYLFPCPLLQLDRLYSTSEGASGDHVSWQFRRIWCRHGDTMESAGSALEAIRADLAAGASSAADKPSDKQLIHEGKPLKPSEYDITNKSAFSNQTMGGYDEVEASTALHILRIEAMAALQPRRVVYKT